MGFCLEELLEHITCVGKLGVVLPLTHKSLDPMDDPLEQHRHLCCQVIKVHSSVTTACIVYDRLYQALPRDTGNVSRSSKRTYTWLFNLIWVCSLTGRGILSLGNY